MLEGTLAAAGGVYLVAAASFLYTGKVTARRERSEDLDAPARAFSIWWWALGTYMAIQGGLTLLAAFGFTPFGLFLGARLVEVPLLVTSVWGLSYYILFLYTGSHRIRTWVAAFYALCGVAFYLTLLAHDPIGVRISTVEATLAYAEPLDGWVYNGVLTAIGAVPILGSIAYLSLLPRLATRAQRYRVVLVATSILAWVGSGLAAQLAGGELFRFLTLTVFGLLASGAVLLAYNPPRPVQAWLEEGPAARPDDRGRAGPGERLSTNG